MSTALEYIQRFISKYFTIPEMYISDIVEIIIIAILVYYVILWFRKSKAWSLLKGILVIVLIMVVAALFHLSSLLWIINKTLSAGIIAVVVIFQPELRRALEELGKKNVLLSVFKFGGNAANEGLSDKSVEEITRATLALSKTKTGALMVVQRTHDLSEYVETGIKLESKITSQLLINIFEKNTPLHDGAVIIVNDRIESATCYLPLSDSTSLSKELGTRHRAGMGISEKADCIVVIVSEETGSISIAREGKLIRYADAAILKSELVKAQFKEEVKSKRFWKGWGRNNENSDDKN